MNGLEYISFQIIAASGTARSYYIAAVQYARNTEFNKSELCIIEADKESTLKKYCNELANVAPQLNGGKIMGPIAAQIYQIRNWYRMRFLVSGNARANLQPVVRAWLDKVKMPANVRVKIDVNPQNFM